MEETMAAWMKFAAPAEEHEFLAKIQGSWKAQTKFWMQPDQPPQESVGKMENEMIMDGRFLQSHYSGDTPFGPFKGMAIDGYDRIRNKYTGIWMDTMGTMMMIFEGDVKDNVRTMVSNYVDPMGKPAKMKGVTTIINENEHKYESWAQAPDGNMFKNMEITYTR